MISDEDNKTQEELASDELLQEILTLEKNVTLKHLEQIGVTYTQNEELGKNLSRITICYDQKTIDVICRQYPFKKKFICDFENEEDRLDFQGFLFANYHLIVKNKILTWIKKLFFIIPVTIITIFAIHSLEQAMKMFVLRTILFVVCAFVSYPIAKSIVEFINNLFKGEC